MNEILKKTVKEVVRVVLSALLAYLGITSTGCIALGDGSNSAFVHHENTTK